MATTQKISNLKARIAKWNREESLVYGPDRVLIYPSEYDGEIYELGFRFFAKAHKINAQKWRELLESVSRISCGGAVVVTTLPIFNRGILNIALATCGSYSEDRVVYLLDFLQTEVFNF